MKNKLVIISIVMAVFAAVTAFNTTGTEKPQYAILEVTTGKNITIVYPDNKFEVKQLTGKISDRQTLLIDINTAINELGEKGYELTSSSTGDVYSQYIFVK